MKFSRKFLNLIEIASQTMMLGKLPNTTPRPSPTCSPGKPQPSWIWFRTNRWLCQVTLAIYYVTMNVLLSPLRTSLAVLSDSALL